MKTNIEEVMTYPANIQQAYSDSRNTIKRFPQHKDNIEDAFDLMLSEIEDSDEPEDLEIDRFYNYMVELTV